MTKKLSVSLPDDLYEELQIEGAENVSAFVAGAIRQQLDRRRLLGFVAELEEELGAVDEGAFAEFDTMLSGVLAARTPAAKPASRPRKLRKAPTTGRTGKTRSATP